MLPTTTNRRISALLALCTLLSACAIKPTVVEHKDVIDLAPTVLALIISRGLAYGMAEPARHSLYTRVPRNVRYKGQDAVDTAVWRFGDMAIATGMNGLKSLGMSIGGFAGLSALAAFAAAGIGWRLWRRVEAVGEATSPYR